MPATRTTPAQATLVEVFSAIQGEGTHVGERQVFVRFLGCDVHCAFCDTPATHQKVRAARAERTPGRRDWEIVENPVPLDRVLDLVRRLDRPPGFHRAVSYTGGEPLLQVRFLAEFLPRLREGSPLPCYLETHGLAPEALERILPHVDIVAMDVKISSATGEPNRFEDHRRFLRLSLSTGSKEVFAKIVIGPETPERELAEACDVVASVDPRVPVILQPATPYGPVKSAPSAELMLRLQEVAAERLRDVRVIPQTHVLMGQL
ncbi:MAG: 7-carboxy-7-deazaguanine synthase QueE [Planctomycetales bacterium]|nr:7-carboxy-7-deazaguanine synthase QueE [Planctomycetales bacterium]